jgi:non-heme chloroperoxidase
VQIRLRFAFNISGKGQGECMPFLTVDKENNNDVKIHFEDYGSGPAVILIHGWPLNGASWEKQTMALLEAGYRVIMYDRRGFGQSSQPAGGYDYETFTDDLNQLIQQLDLNDVTLVGFSMGTGEATRYLGKFGSDRISKAVLIGVIPPYLLKKTDNATGVDQDVFDDIQANLKKDRPAFLMEFLKNFYNYDQLEGKRISEEDLHASWNVALVASAIGTLQCVKAWLTDFRKDVARLNVPTLIIHGDADQILPIEATAEPLAKKLKDAKFLRIKGAPHGLLWTHAEEINEALLEFLGPAARSESRLQRREVAEERSQLQ